MGEALEHVRDLAAHTHGALSWGSLQIVAALAFSAALFKGPKRAIVAALAAGLALAAALGPILRLPSLFRSGFELAALGPFGITAYGALAGCAIGYALGARAAGASVARALDRVALALGLLLLFGRLGCFLAGCDFGAPSTLPWAVRYGVDTPCLRAQLDAGLVAADAHWTLPVHPTQLYEASLGLLIAAGALLAGSRSRRPGGSFLTGAAIYAIGRAAIDCVRGDGAHGTVTAPSTSQWLSLLVLSGIALRLASPRTHRLRESESSAGALSPSSGRPSPSAPDRADRPD